MGNQLSTTFSAFIDVMIVEDQELLRYRFVSQLRQVLFAPEKIPAQGYLITLTSARKNTIIPNSDKSLGEYM